MKDKSVLVGDVVGIIMEQEDGVMAVLFAHLIDINPDKKGWWSVTFRSIPGGEQFSWLLDDEQIRQGEFTMGGKKRQVILFSRIGLVPIVEEKKKEVVQTITEEDSLF